MAEGLVLNPTTHLVDTAVAHSDDVEGVGHAGGVVEARRQPGPEGLRQVGGDDLDAPQPPWISVGRPSPQVSRGVALDQVDEDLDLQVDEAGGVDGRV